MNDGPPGRAVPSFATTTIAQYGGIPSAFFTLSGLGDVLFIFDPSRLSDIRDAAAPDVPLAVLHQPIHELYGVDVPDLCV